MAKKESSLWQLVLSLTLITIIAAVGLAAVYSVTKTPIEAAQQKKKSDAIQLVLPGFTGKTQQKTVYLEDYKDPFTLYFAYQDEKLMGVAVETYTDKAFSGRFDLMVGFNPEGKILGTAVLKCNETPGLGDKINASKSNFSSQFNNKNPEEFQLKVKKDGGDVDAITAATISSRAFCDAINHAYAAFLQGKEDKDE